jgi:hypothetical protein
MKANVKLTIFVTFLACTLTLLIGLPHRAGSGGILPTVHAGGCSEATLQGAYLFIVREDNRSDLPDPRFPAAVAGQRAFDGAGKLSQVATVSRGGQIRRDISSGTYTLGSDCTGTMTIDEDRHWDIFVAGDGSEGAAVRTDEGNIGAQTFKKR